MNAIGQVSGDSADGFVIGIMGVGDECFGAGNFVRSNAGYGCELLREFVCGGEVRLGGGFGTHGRFRLGRVRRVDWNFAVRIYFHVTRSGVSPPDDSSILIWT